MPKVFSVMAYAQGSKSPYPPFPKGGTQPNPFESSSLEKGDSGGFKNQQSEEIFGKCYNSSSSAAAGLIPGNALTALAGLTPPSPGLTV
jgi:hypothetical protein